MQCVERSRFEKDSVKGQMQATYYSVRFGGNIYSVMLILFCVMLIKPILNRSFASHRRRYCGLLCGRDGVQYSNLGMGFDLPSDLFHQRRHSLPASHAVAVLVRRNNANITNHS